MPSNPSTVAGGFGLAEQIGQQSGGVHTLKVQASLRKRIILALLCIIIHVLQKQCLKTS